MDLEERKVISVTEGKDQHTLKGFKHDLMVHDGRHPDNIKEFSVDMSPAFIKGAEEQFPNASLTFNISCAFPAVARLLCFCIVC